MLWLSVTLALTFQLPIATASFHCVECAQTLILNSLQRIDTARSDCKFKNETSTMCMATLQIDYEHNKASVLFNGFSQNLLNVSDGTRMITHSMQISLDTSSMKRTIQVYCARNKSCVDEMNEIYDGRDISRIMKLQEEMQSKLFNSSNSADLLCENNQNKTIPCPNGFCQLIHNGESNFTRNCIPKGFSAFSPSILIASSMVEQFEKRSPFMYICNQHLCNNLVMAEKVQQSLEELGLITPFNRQPTYELKTTTTASQNTAVRIFPQTVIGLQCILLLVTMILSEYLFDKQLRNKDFSA